MRAKSPSRHRGFLTVLIGLVMSAAGLAGCVGPQESGGGDPDVGPNAVGEEQVISGQATPEEPFTSSVGVGRDSGNVEADLSLTDARFNDTAPESQAEDTNATSPTTAPESEEEAGAATDAEPVTVLVQLRAPTAGGEDEFEVIEEEEVTLEPGDGKHITIGADLSELQSLFEDYPEGAALVVELYVEVSDGPVDVIGHYRSFQ